MKLLWQLFLTFAKVGVMTFGGGYAMLPILQREIVENKGWANEDELTDYYAVGQCTPGVIAVNTATFVGQKLKGNIGGIVATLGVVFPSLVIITALASVIAQVSHLAWVRNAFAGINVCVGVLIANAVAKLWKKSVIDWLSAAVFAVVLVLSLLPEVLPEGVLPDALHVSPVILVILAGAVGIIARYRRVPPADQTKGKEGRA